MPIQPTTASKPALPTGSYWPHECPSCGESLEDILHDLRMKFIELTAQVNQFEALFQASKKREETLQLELAKAQAKIRDTEKRLYGRKSESSSTQDSSKSQPEILDDTPKRKRGQQPGHPTPIRRTYPELERIEEVHDVHENEQTCPCCGLTREEFFKEEESEIIEVDVKAYVRKVVRKSRVSKCNCPSQPKVVSPLVVGALFPGSQLGVSVWVEILLAKYRYGEPINRLLDRWADIGFSPPRGTIHSNLASIGKLISPVAELIAARNRSAHHWHIDETRWPVYVEIPGKAGHRWWLWVFVTEDTVVFKIDPTRSSRVVYEHLGENPEGIASVDRYSAYKSVSLHALNLFLAFCWAHVRRDFLELEVKWPELKDWTMVWLNQISNLFAINNIRRQTKLDDTVFVKADRELRTSMDDFRSNIDAGLDNHHLHDEARKVLHSLDKHWEGLKIFVDHPQIPMDNNLAERTLRPQVVGRKNFWGSGSEHTARLQADLGTLFFTLERNNINLKKWLYDYLSVCSLHGGRPPDDIEKYLPWSSPKKSLKRWERGDVAA